MHGHEFGLRSHQQPSSYKINYLWVVGASWVTESSQRNTMVLRLLYAEQTKRLMATISDDISYFCIVKRKIHER